MLTYLILQRHWYLNLSWEEENIKTPTSLEQIDSNSASTFYTLAVTSEGRVKFAWMLDLCILQDIVLYSHSPPLKVGKNIEETFPH